MTCALTFWIAGGMFTMAFVDFKRLPWYLGFMLGFLSWFLWPMFLAFEINSRMKRK